MAHTSLNQYLILVDTAWKEKDGSAVSDLLSFKHAHVINSRLQLDAPETAVERVLDPPLDEMVAAHLRCLTAVNNQNFLDGFRYHSLLFQSFIKVLQSQRDENWALPVMYALCLDLRLMAILADKEQKQKGAGKPKETLEKAAECLMGCFRICAADNRSTDCYTKRWGMLTVVNHLFKIYFRINRLHLLKPLIRAIESSPYKDQFSLGQQITYKYYVGRKAMFDSDYKTADEYLSFAFQRCHKLRHKNKRLILVYLVPVKILLGYMPSEKVLKKYDLMQLWEVAEAVKYGNILQLNGVMEKHGTFFIKCGIYLIIEKLKIIAYRNLFKRVYLIMNKHQVPIEAFLIGLKMMMVNDVDANETECIIANLIYEGKMKGYISHQHQKVVVSKQNAFPPLNTLVGS